MADISITIYRFSTFEKIKFKANNILNTAFVGVDDNILHGHKFRKCISGFVGLSNCIPTTMVCSSNKVIRHATIEDILDFELQHLYSGKLQQGDPIFQTSSAYSNIGMILTEAFFNTRDPSFMLLETKEQAIERIRADVFENQKLLNEKLSKHAVFFAWPWGYQSDIGKIAIRSLGIKGFVTSRKGTNCWRLNLDNIYRVEHRNLTKFKFKLTLFVCQNLFLGKIYKLLS